MAVCQRGSYQKPTIYDILWLQLLFLPVHIVKYVAWFTHWTWRYTVCRRDYDDVDKQYLIRRFMKISEGQYNVSAVPRSLSRFYVVLRVWAILWKESLMLPALTVFLNCVYCLTVE